MMPIDVETYANMSRKVCPKHIHMYMHTHFKNLIVQTFVIKMLKNLLE